MTQLPKSVRRQLAEAPDLAGRFSAKHSSADHSSADMLSAFAENRLNRQQRAELLEHLSVCADCRQVVWHVLPELQAEMVQPSLVRSASADASWFHSPALRWSAVAACVIVVGSAVMLQHNMQRKPIAAEQRPAVFEKTMQPNAAPPSEAANPQPASGSAAVGVMLQPSRPDQTDHTPQTAANVPARALAQPAMNVPMHANAFTGTTAANYNVNAEIAGKILPRWTLTSDGLLQRSLDAGKSWQPIAIPGNSSTLHAIAAHGPHVWVGGAGGVLYHSSDAGKDWLQVKPNVDGQTLADDVIGIEFSSIQAGKLITNRQETWITADGGNTWQKK